MVRQNVYILSYNKKGSTVTSIKKWDIIKKLSFNVPVENAQSGKLKPIIDPNVLLLPRKDATLYGTLPKLENRVYSKCKQCNRIFNPVDIVSHCLKSPHFKYPFQKPFSPPSTSEPMSNSPVELKLHVMILNLPIESAAQNSTKSPKSPKSLSSHMVPSSSSHYDHSSTSHSSSSHSNKHKKSSSSSPRKSVSSTSTSSATNNSSKKVLVKDYDPDMYCGVQHSSEAPCLKPCSYHRMQLRKLVPRSKDINQIIVERKAAKEKDSKLSAAPSSYTAPNEEAKESLNQHTSYVPVVAKIATTNATIEQPSVSTSYVPIMPRAVNHTRQLATSLVTPAKSIENEKKSAIALTNGYISHTKNSENMQDNVGTVPVLVQVQFLQINNYIVSLESPQSAGSKPSPLTEQSVVLPIQNNSDNVKMYKSHPKSVIMPSFEARRVGGAFLLANPLLESERNELLTALNPTRETVANNNREISVLNHINNSGNRTNCKRPAGDKLVTSDNKRLIPDVNGLISMLT